MTKQDYINEVTVLNEKIAVIEKEKDVLLEKYIADNADLSLVNKKVVITTKDYNGNKKDILCWLGGYELSDKGNFNIRPVLFKDKVTGGMSTQRLHIYTSSIISLLPAE